MSNIELVTFRWAICKTKTKRCFSYKWPSSSAYFILVFRFKSFPLKNAGECRVPLAITWHAHITQKCKVVFIDLECVLKPLYIIITRFLSSWKYPAWCDALVALLLWMLFFFYLTQANCTIDSKNVPKCQCLFFFNLRNCVYSHCYLVD